MRLVKNNYLEHLSPNFWYIYGDNSLRYFTGNMGMFYLFEMPFWQLVCIFLSKIKKAGIFTIGWILLAPIPASLVGRSFAVRSISMLPAPFFIAGYGLYKFTAFFKRPKTAIAASLVVSLVAVFFMGSLLIRYYLEYPVYAATWWGWENKKAIDYAKEREAKYDKIFISDFYTEPHWLLLSITVLIRGNSA